MNNSCSYCECIVPVRNTIVYLVSDLGDEMYAWVETKLKLPIEDNSFLCEECFESLTKQWSNLQEPEVEESTLIEVKFDPLSAEVESADTFSIKEEKENEYLETTLEFKLSDSNEQQCQKSEVLETTDKKPTVQASNADTIQESGESFQDSDESIVDSIDSDSSEASAQSSKSEENKSQSEDSPPLLIGTNLKSGTKCDSCNAVIFKMPYRKLPDGPEKTVIAMKRLDRESSPERVCPKCWDRARASVKHFIAKQKKTEKSLEDVDESGRDKSIKIPGYQKASATSSRCIVKGCKDSGRFRCPTYIRKLLLKDYNVFVKECTRICQTHRREYHRDWSAVKTQQNLYNFKTRDIQEMLDFLRDEALKFPE